MEFLPDSGEDRRSRRDDEPTTAPEPQPVIKAKVAVAAVKDAGRAGAAVRCAFEPDHDLEGAASGRSCGGVRLGAGFGIAPPAVDVKTLHAQTGELKLTNDVLESALSKAGLLSAKR